MLRPLTLCLSFLMMLAPAMVTSAAEPQVGDLAPAFELPGSDGAVYKLSELVKSGPVVLAWFPKAFTPGCTKECQSLRDGGQSLRAAGVAYFTASCDTAEENKKFAESLELDFPILSDPQQQVARAYGVVTDERPRPLRWTFYIGTDGKILHIEKQVETARHAEQILETLARLGLTAQAS